MKIHYAIVFVSDMDRSVAFYRDILGVPLRFQSPGWSELATEGATLALHLAESPPASEDPRELEPAGSCRWGFGVPDLDAFHRRMVDHGVRCLQEPHTAFGARLALYADPDGMRFGVGEHREGR